MYIVTLKLSTGKSLDIPFAQTPDEILLSQSIDFSKAVEQFEDWQKEQFKEDVDVLSIGYMQGYLKRAINAIKEFTGSDEVTRLETGKFYDHLIEIINENPKKLDKDSWDDTLFKLYANTFRIINEYKPKLPTKNNHEFTVDNKTFVIPYTYVSALTGKVMFESRPAGQMMEALEVMRVYNNNAKNDPQGSIRFTSILKLISILAREKVNGEIETFPTKEQEIEDMIAKRVKFFAPRIKMTHALDIEAFFLRGGTQ